MARKSVIAPSVIESERFTGMDLAARALYPYALTNADSIGVVVNPRAVARGADIPNPEEAVAELEQNGYLLRFETSEGSNAWIVTNWFQHNRRDASKEQRSQFFNEVGALFTLNNGVYQRCPESAPRVPRKRPESAPNRNVIGIGIQGNLTEGNQREGNVTQEQVNAAPCPNCGSFGYESGETLNGCAKCECMACGEVYWVSNVTGEVVADPYRTRTGRV